MDRTYGKEYDKSLTTKEIAARVRGEIKAAIKSGALPAGINVSTTFARFAGGTSIDVRVVLVPEGFRVLNPERALAAPTACRADRLPYYTAEARALLKQLEEMLGAYNHDGSDSMTDHFDVNFYAHVGFTHEFEAIDRARIVAEAPAPAPEPAPEPAPAPAPESAPALTPARITTTPTTIHLVTGPGATKYARGIHDLRGPGPGEALPFRAPHHSASTIACIQETAIAAGGLLFLDEVLEFRAESLHAVLRTWVMMDVRFRPVLVLGYTPLGEGGYGSESLRAQLVGAQATRLAVVRALLEGFDVEAPTLTKPLGGAEVTL